MESRPYTLRGCLTGLFFITFAVVVCGGVSFFAIDQKCIGDSTRWLPDYPQATLVVQEYTVLRPFGIGATARVLYSPDDENTVRRWYIDTWGRVGAENSDRGWASPSYFVSKAEDGAGSSITLYSECASR
jgi:hypothetical protein